MKNKNGFTLVELLAVIAILAVIMIVVFPSAWDALNNVDTKITEINKKMVKEAARTFAQEIVFCEMSNDAKNLLTSLGITNYNCSTVMGNFASGKEVTVEQLRKNNYLQDDSRTEIGGEGHCNGTLLVTINASDYSIKVDEKDPLVCNNN